MGFLPQTSPKPDVTYDDPVTLDVAKGIFGAAANDSRETSQG